MVWNYQNADCSLKKNIVSFIIIFDTPSFPIGADFCQAMRQLCPEKWAFLMVRRTPVRSSFKSNWHLPLTRKKTAIDRWQTDRVTILPGTNLWPFTLTYDLDFQHPASYGHDPYTRKKDQRLDISKTFPWKRMDTTDFFTFLANTVGNTVANQGHVQRHKVTAIFEIYTTQCV